MRKMLNKESIMGYVYQHKLEVKTVKNEKSKNYGTEFIGGDLFVAVDEEGLNVLPIHFSFVTEFNKNGNANLTYTALKKIIDTPEKTWIMGGKENAFKVKVDTNLELNDYINQEGKRVSAKRNGGGFVTLVDDFGAGDRNKFEMDMVITKVTHHDANPERTYDTDCTYLKGAVFDFRNALLPVELVVRTPEGMAYFENFEVSDSNPLATRLWGEINCKTIRHEYTEASAFGAPSVRTVETKSREWLVTGAGQAPYDFGDETFMTTDELIKAMQDREIHWAEIKQNQDAYNATRNNTASAFGSGASVSAVKPGQFSF